MEVFATNRQDRRQYVHVFFPRFSVDVPQMRRIRYDVRSVYPVVDTANASPKATDARPAYGGLCEGNGTAGWYGTFADG